MCIWVDQKVQRPPRQVELDIGLIMVVCCNSSAALRSLAIWSPTLGLSEVPMLSKQRRLGKVLWRHAIVSHSGRGRDWYIWIVVNTRNIAAGHKRQCSQKQRLNRLSASIISIAKQLTSGSPRQSVKTHSVLIFVSAHRAETLRARSPKLNMMKAISRSPSLAIFLKFLDHLDWYRYSWPARPGRSAVH